MENVGKLGYCLLGITITLLVVGVLFLAGVSANFSQENFGHTTYFFFHQITRGILPGLILGFIAFKLKLEAIKKYSIFLIGAAIFLMLIVFIPGLGISSGGASRWLNLGFGTFQPSELLKLSFIVYLAAWLSNPDLKKRFIINHKKVKNFKERAKKEFLGLLPFLIILTIVFALLMLQSDMSTLVVIGAIAIMMYWIANTPLWHNLTIVLAGSGLLWLFIKLFPYRINRIAVWLDSNFDPMGLGYQVKQITIAIGSGGLWGVGLGSSVQKFGFIPQTMADSIFAIFAEETGFIGSLFLVLLYLSFFIIGFLIFRSAKDDFSKFMVLGLSFWICFQAFFNIGAMIGLLPLTGIPLPFISYGGSHIIFELIAVGLLLNVSKKC